jgi:GNAT superfamily N-acetyltransferase
MPDRLNEGITIDTDQNRLDLKTIHEFLTNSYLARGIPMEIVERSIRGSLCFGLYDGDQQVGFARVISDYATFAYLADVFVLPSHRGRGLGKTLMTTIVAHPSLQGLRRWLLATRDAHDLYAKFGFCPAGGCRSIPGAPRTECLRVAGVRVLTTCAQYSANASSG